MTAVTRRVGEIRGLRALALSLLVLVVGGMTGQAMAASTTARNWSADITLTDWVERELVPHLAEVFSKHPRFKGQSLQFVGLRDNSIMADPDELTRSVVRRLQLSLQTSPGVRLWWPPRADDAGACVAREAPDYRIALEFVRLGTQRHRLVIRALDVVERHWVSGFGIEWQGALTRAEQTALAARPDQQAEPGRRSNPFGRNQADLLARALAQELHRNLCGSLGDPVALYLEHDADATPVEARVRQLLGHNLSSGRDVLVVDNEAAADLRLAIELVEIDGELHQVWVRGYPAKTESSLLDVHAQAYVSIDTSHGSTIVAASRGDDERAEVLATPPSKPASLASLRVVVPPDPRYCKSADPWRFGAPVISGSPRIAERGCFALDLKARHDVKIFLLSVDPRRRSQRLLPTACRAFGRARSVLVRGERLQFPVKANAPRRAFRHPGYAGTHSFYAVAATDHAAASRIEAELARWHDACRNVDNSTLARHLAEKRLARLFEAVADLDGRAEVQRVDVRYVTRGQTLAARYDDGGQQSE